MKPTKFKGIFEDWKGKKKVLYTQSEDSFFGEDIKDGYREFSPKRSKLAAAVLKRISILPIKKNSKILYLGASHGYTPSYISDIIESKGELYCLDFAPRVVRDLVKVCKKRENMLPLLFSATKPEEYKDKIGEVNIIYQDIAQKNQVEIFLKNINMFLKKGDYALLALKSRSIDSVKKPFDVYKQVEKELVKGVKIIDKKELAPFEKDHMFYVCQKL